MLSSGFPDWPLCLFAPKISSHVLNYNLAKMVSSRIFTKHRSSHKQQFALPFPGNNPEPRNTAAPLTMQTVVGERQSSTRTRIHKESPTPHLDSRVGPFIGRMNRRIN